MSAERDDFGKRFGERLRLVRTTRGLSQEELALAAGLHRTHISLIERNRRSVRLETIQSLAIALRVQPASLIPTTIEVGDADVVRADDLRLDRAKLDGLFPFIREYQELASKRGIGDIFQDNGGKLLQTLLLLDLTVTGRREGNDAKDADGNEYELKTVNIELKQSFSTNHHLNAAILHKYRTVTAWFFSIYRGIEIVEIYRMLPGQLEDRYFSHWEKKWTGSGIAINNPQIPVQYVRENGERVYQDPVNDRL